jgi:hypothetical protein
MNIIAGPKGLQPGDELTVCQPIPFPFFLM